MCAYLGSADPSANLIKLRQTKHIGAVHHHSVGGWDVQTTFDNGCGQEDIVFPIIKRVHAVTMSFGLRNVQDHKVALGEFHRVLLPGGRLVICEFSRVRGLLGTLYRWYLRNVLPIVAKLLSKNGQGLQVLAVTGDRAQQFFIVASQFAQLVAVVDQR